MTSEEGISIVPDMKDIFLADAHLRRPADANYRKLLEFLGTLEGNTRTLYLLGDIFEFWVGYRYVVFTAYLPLLEGLRRLREAGTEIVFIEGNHDFHMGLYFTEILGCRVLPQEGSFDIDGKRVFLAHGDLMDEADVGYRRLRRVLRSLPLKVLIRIIPPDWTWGIAAWMGRVSKSQQARHEKRNPTPLLRNHATARFTEGYQVVMTGHFHLPLHEQDEQGEMFALGDWIRDFSYVECDDGAFSLRSF